MRRASRDSSRRARSLLTSSPAGSARAQRSDPRDDRASHRFDDTATDQGYLASRPYTSGAARPSHAGDRRRRAGDLATRPGDGSTWVEPGLRRPTRSSLASLDARGAAGASRGALLDRVDELTAIPSFVWHVHDPARAVADRFGIAARVTRLGFAGGTVPQSVLFDAATRIAAGGSRTSPWSWVQRR